MLTASIEAALPTRRSASSNMLVGFNNVALIGALVLASVVADSWYAQEKNRGNRLFRMGLCELPQFREFVVYTLESRSHQFAFQGSSAQLLDTKSVLAAADTTHCDDKNMIAATDALITGFPLERMFAWMHMNHEVAKEIIEDSQLVERLYAWSIGCLLACVLVAMLGGATCALTPSSPIVIKCQLPLFFVALAALLAGLALFIEAHSQCLYGMSSFFSFSDQDSRLVVSMFFVISLVAACLAGWFSSFAAQKGHGLPAAQAICPGIYGVWPEDNVVNEAGGSGSGSNGLAMDL